MSTSESTTTPALSLRLTFEGGTILIEGLARRRLARPARRAVRPPGGYASRRGDLLSGRSHGASEP